MQGNIPTAQQIGITDLELFYLLDVHQLVTGFLDFSQENSRSGFFILDHEPCRLPRYWPLCFQNLQYLT